MRRPLACLLVIALAGCGRAAGPAAQHDERTDTTGTPPPTNARIDARGLTPAGRTALRYALAARTWTPRTYARQYRRQLALSAGPLRRALTAAPPTRAQLAAHRADDAAATATARAVTRLLDGADDARYGLLLDERSSAAGQTARQRARYLVELRRRDGRWLVTQFTIAP